MPLVTKTEQGPRDDAEIGFEQLLEKLSSGSPIVRRSGALALSAHPEAIDQLLANIPLEEEPAVREAIFSALQAIGGETVIEGIVPLLHSDDAGIRNGAVELLANFPMEVESHIDAMLEDPDSDMRIFTVNVLQDLAHPRVAEWLLRILEKDDQINVCTTALDSIADIGTEDMLPKIQAVKDRFKDDPFVEFAVNLAVKRIQGEE